MGSGVVRKEDRERKRTCSDGFVSLGNQAKVTVELKKCLQARYPVLCLSRRARMPLTGEPWHCPWMEITLRAAGNKTMDLNNRYDKQTFLRSAFSMISMNCIILRHPNQILNTTPPKYLNKYMIIT